MGQVGAGRPPAGSVDLQPTDGLGAGCYFERNLADRFSISEGWPELE